MYFGTMRRTWGHRAITGALLFTVLGSVKGCAHETNDGVLWRQIAAFKDPLGHALEDSMGSERITFVPSLKSNSLGLPGQYWDGSSNPVDLNLGDGGLVFYGIQETSNSVATNILISSGLRAPEKDPLSEPSPYPGPLSGSKAYSGPPAIYTCFVATVEFSAQTATSWTYDEGTCEASLVETLDDGAKPYPVAEFNG